MVSSLNHIYLEKKMKNVSKLLVMALLSIGSANAMQPNPENGNARLIDIALVQTDFYGAREAEELLNSGKADVNYTTNDGVTPLLAALSMTSDYIGSSRLAGKRYPNINHQLVSLLIEKGADVNAVASNGRTPLMLASQFADSEIVKRLIDRGANVEAKDNDGLDANYYADINTDQTEAQEIKKLLEEAKMRVKKIL